MPETAHYGAWKSPITADLIVGATIGLGHVELHGDDVYWMESRPTEGGRSVIVRRNALGTVSSVNPAPLNARTRVHEYGGGEYTLAPDGVVYFSNFSDQRLYRATPTTDPSPLTDTPGMRYADAVIDVARNRLICVREDHSNPDHEAVNTIAAVDLTTGAETILVQGHDFFSTPRLSPDGTQLAWLAWDHPNMPWDGCELFVARIEPDGRPGRARIVAGSVTEAVCQPQWSPDGRLYFIAEPTGWWNIHRMAANGAIENLTPIDAEFGRPHWTFGAPTYDFDGPDRIVCSYCERGTWRFATLDTRTKQLRSLDTPLTRLGGIRARNGRAYFVGASTTQGPAVVAVDLDTGATDVLKRSSEITVDSGYISQPETIEFPTEEGLAAYGIFYPAANKDYVAPADEKSPLLVMSHGGPTAATDSALSLRVQYWTSRGISVLDVNYGGSTGYGRAFRRRLNGRWGIVDVDDCVNGALYLARRGLVDTERMAITGGSAGGYTTLCALAFRDAFKAGASHFGVADLEALARDTHKFESRYLDGLIGPYPERLDLYTERSPVHHVDGLDCPVIFFQGLEDEVVPPNQAESMVAALRAKGVPVAYLPFEGEQHGFRRAENIKRSLEAELYFYSRIFAFDLADHIDPVQIDNLDS